MDEILKKNEIQVTEEQIQAAYALNLCSVSVSQIIDYNDIYILEQEYENILNNLNLQNIPKDEALLDILKRLLETITFFRIADGDKALIEKEYQHKMKNAIWSAMPNPGALVSAGLSGLKAGNAVGTVISVAATVGTAYMNYRKTKAENDLNHEKQLWELRRTAIEQLNNLRQQLFETSWRLADKYDFPDILRLTEKQIKEYNNILMDSDEVRKYERLEYIKDRFKAYPPFWYYLGNTANSIAASDRYGLSEVDREEYRNKAKKHFLYFSDINKYNLLRVDNISSACYLELVDLLDPVLEADDIFDYTNRACEQSGDSLDILQLCAVSYLRIGKIDAATKVLRKLVNEQYNTISNAQLLSTIYVDKYITKEDNESKANYMLLATRVNKEYLFPMPLSRECDKGQLLMDHMASLRKILLAKYALVFELFIKKYEREINKIIPLPGYYWGNSVDEDIYSQTQYARDERVYQVVNVMGDKEKASEYMDYVANIAYSSRLLEILNSFFENLTVLDFVREENTRIELSNIIRSQIYSNRKLILDADHIILNFTAKDYRYIQENVSLKLFAGDFFDKFIAKIKVLVGSLTSFTDFTIAEMNLSELCKKVGIPEPEYMYDTRNNYIMEDFEPTYFSRDLLQDGARISSERITLNNEMFSAIKQALSDGKIVINASQAEVSLREEAKTSVYFYNTNINNEDIKAKTLAVINDKSIMDSDLILTTEGIIPVIRGIIKKTIPYSSVAKVMDGGNIGIILGENYFNDGINIELLIDLCDELKKYEVVKK